MTVSYFQISIALFTFNEISLDKKRERNLFENGLELG